VILALVLQVTPDLGFEKSVDVPDRDLRHVVPNSDVPGAVVAREVCDFLATLVAA
jgi:hypothetical protein